MEEKDRFPVGLTVAICLGIAAAVGGYLLYFYSKKAKGLDFVERLEHATRAARGVAADAALTHASIYYVNSSGHVELPNKGMGSRDTHPLGIEFRFRSTKLASTTAAPGQLGRPQQSGNAAGAGCIIEVTAAGPGTRGADDLRVRQRDSSRGGCGESMPTQPRCSLAQVWSTAIARSAPSDALADIELEVVDAKPRWDFKITDWNRRGATASRPDFEVVLADDCAP